MKYLLLPLSLLASFTTFILLIRGDKLKLPYMSKPLRHHIQLTKQSTTA